MDGFIRPEGWDNWKDAKNEATAWYGEFGSTGPGAKDAAKATERAGWARKMTATDAAAFAPESFLRGSDGWNPVKK